MSRRPEEAMLTETATTITMPRLGESVTEGTIGAWLKAIGDRVEKYEPLVEVVTDKVNAEIPSPVAGVLVEILIEPETTVPVGAAVCRIAESGASGVAVASPLETSPRPVDPPTEMTNGHPTMRSGVFAATPGRTGEIPDETVMLRARSSPVVRRIGEEHGIDIALVTGTGISGRVTKRDLLAYLAATPAVVDRPDAVDSTIVPALAAMPAPGPRSAPATSGVAAPVGEHRPVALFPGDEVVPLTPMRRTIAEHMVRSERTAPHVTVVMEVDMTGVVAYRAARKEAFRQGEGVELTSLPFAIKAVTLALRDHPQLNAVWDEERIIQRRAINIGVAVALPDGLIVPVISNADRLSITGLAHAVARLAARARDGALTPDEVAGGTFTVNNPGTFGSLVSTPILVQPQAAILSTEAIVKRPVVIDDMIAIRSMMNLSLSIDHRVLDGLAAARFLQTVKGWLEAVDDHLPLS
jgi:2-oxoisovalerate dehydrogenase E2 component (dihydrolipoyl transacylase)